MTVNTGINASLRRPQTFHRFTYLLGGRLLTPLAQSLVLIGMQSDAATATAEQVYDIQDVEQGDALFGRGSEVALMIRTALKTASKLGSGPRIKAIGITEATGNKNVQTLTFSGTATESGNFVFSVAGRVYAVGVSSGDAHTTVATAVNTVLQSVQEELPIASTVATPVVSLTNVVKGTNGSQVSVVVISKPAGIACVVATGTAGSGIVDITLSLDAIAGIDIDGIAIGNFASADVTDALTHLAAMWQPQTKKWRWLGIGTRGTIGAATTLASAANDRSILVFCCEGSPSLPCEIAAAGMVALLSRERPNTNYDGMGLPLYPCTVANAFTGTEVETALAAGIIPLSPVIDVNTRSVVDGVLKIEKMVTTKTTENSLPYEPLREVVVSRVGAFMARQIDIAYVARFGPSANPDGVLLDDDTIDRVRDMIAALCSDAEDFSIIKNVAENLAELVVEEDDESVGRCDVDLPYTVVMPLHQVAAIHRVKVGG